MMRSTLFTTTTVMVSCCFLLSVTSVTSHPRKVHGQDQGHHHRFNQYRIHKNDVESWLPPVTQQNQEAEHETDASNRIRKNKHHASSRRDFESQDSSSKESDDHGSHLYVMATDHLKPEVDEDMTLSQAFQSHMQPTNQSFKNPHDIYAYKLPSDLWFVVRYKKNAEGTMDKYMNVVSSFTNYLDKLDTSTKSISVNVKGVETVFRLTSKSKLNT